MQPPPGLPINAAATTWFHEPSPRAGNACFSLYSVGGFLRAGGPGPVRSRRHGRDTHVLDLSRHLCGRLRRRVPAARPRSGARADAAGGQKTTAQLATIHRSAVRALDHCGPRPWSLPLERHGLRHGCNGWRSRQIALSYAVCLWAMRVNRFFSSVIRIQDDRGQTVISAGPYAFVRHPVTARHRARARQRPCAELLARRRAPGRLSLLFLFYRTIAEDRVLRARDSRLPCLCRAGALAAHPGNLVTEVEARGVNPARIFNSHKTYYGTNGLNQHQAGVSSTANDIPSKAGSTCGGNFWRRNRNRDQRADWSGSERSWRGFSVGKIRAIDG